MEMDKSGERTTSLSKHERYFAEMLVANYQYLRDGEYTLVELILRTMCEQLIEEGTISSLEKMVLTSL